MGCVMHFSFDFDREIGDIRAMHGVGQPPMMGIDDSMLHFLTEAGIPYSRLHDVGGAYGNNRFVDIHNIFRDFGADETKEESYDFAFTDILISALMKARCRPIFRLGETIENQHYVKAYRIFPPRDNAKWARICEHIIRHYNEGWANGFRYGVEYWEIWNEPDNGRDDTENQMWHGTKEQYYALYEVTAKHLKAVFGDGIKVGGLATCGFRYILSDPQAFGIDHPKNDEPCYSNGRSKNFLDWVEGFFEHIKRTGAPIDFFSWHSYLTVRDTVACAKYCKSLLERHGYGHLETQLNEWNNCVVDEEDYGKAIAKGRRLLGTAEAAARAAEMMCALQIDTDTDIACYYDARVGTSVYGGMFNPITLEPFKLYYSFLAFGELYRLGKQVHAEYERADGIYALAAVGNGKRAILLVNSTAEEIEITTDLCGSYSSYLVDEQCDLEDVAIEPTKFRLGANSVLLIKG